MCPALKSSEPGTSRFRNGGGGGVRGCSFSAVFELICISGAYIKVWSLGLGFWVYLMKLSGENPGLGFRGLGVAGGKIQ